MSEPERNSARVPAKEPYSLSIIMPVFNEQDVIADVVSEFAEILERFERPEFVIINDCSTDRTFSILETLNSKYPFMRLGNASKNRGHGPTLARAYREATGDFVFHSDSDRQFFADDFWLLWEKMKNENLDLVIDYRENRKDSLARLVLTRMVRLFLRFVFQAQVRDSNSPFRLYRRSALDKLMVLLPVEPMIPSILMTVAAHKLGMRVGWVRVRHLARTSGKSFLRSWKIFRLCAPAVKEVLQFRRRFHEPSE